MSLFSESFRIKLNPEQEVAMNHFRGPGLVLAVPGSGKTTLLIMRTLNLIQNHGVDPRRILSLTFSKAAALDMNERFLELYPESPFKIGFSTIHRFCYSVLLSYFKQIDRDYKLLEGKEAPISKQKLLKQLFFELHKSPITDDQMDELQAAIGYVKNMMIDAKSYETNLPGFERLFNQYEQYKKDHLLMDFDDMLTMCYSLLSKKPEVLRLYQNKFDFIQVDECQDTSKVQHSIIGLLSREHQNIYMVADDDQSIYGFRGAYPEAIVNIDDFYPNTKKYLLKINYRSSADIIKVCDQIINKNQTRYKKEFQSHHEFETELKMVYTDTLEEQCQYLIDAHKKNDLKKAVLFRNNMSMIPIVDMLERNDIDFSIKEVKLNFFSHWVLSDILAFLKVALVPNDIDAFERIYYKMNAYISKLQFNYIKDHYNGINLFDTLTNLPDLESFKRKNLRKIKGNFEYLSKLKPELAIAFVEDELQYQKYVQDTCKRKNLSQESVFKVLDIVKLIASKTDSITEFFERLNTLKSILFKATHNTNPYALRLLSMHASKGLEFDHVFLVDIDHKTFPSSFAVDLLDEGNNTLYEEERRLFYVALSRAKSRITVLHTKFKNSQYNKASEFAKDYIEKAGNILITEHYKKDATKENHKHGFKVGHKVLHTSFGVGFIIELEGDRLMIEFTDTVKTLSASICNDSKILIKLD